MKVRTLVVDDEPVARAGLRAMLTAFGYDWVPGNLAGGLALDRAGQDAVRVDIGYFISGKAGMSGGTMASITRVPPHRPAETPTNPTALCTYSRSNKSSTAFNTPG